MSNKNYSSNLIVPIKRDKDCLSNLDDLFGYTSDDVENTNTIEVVNGSDLCAVLEEYVTFLDYIPLNGAKNANQSSKTEAILTPNEISSFLHLTTGYYDHCRYSWKTGMFISKLIQNSYDNGNNHFKFNLTNIPPIVYFGDKIKGDISNSINLDLVGNIGAKSFQNAKSINLNVIGDVGAFSFEKAEQCRVIINGNCMGFFGKNSLYLNGYISGNAGACLGNSSSVSKFITLGDIYSLGNFSHSLLVATKGHVFSSFGFSARNLELYVGKTIPKKKLKKPNKVVFGENAQNHPKYIAMMQEFERRVKE
jgi:hypothetical protein